MRRAARERCEIACFSAADHWPRVRPPGGSGSGSKMRVVAEALVAPRGRRDAAAARAAPDQRLEAAARAAVAREGQREDAHVARATPIGGQGAELGQELRVVGRVGRVRAGVAARPHAGAAAQRIHLEARVVGQRRQPRTPGVEPGLQARVGLERLAGLLGLVGDADVVGRHELDVGPDLQELAQLAQLVARARRDEQAAPRPRHLAIAASGGRWPAPPSAPRTAGRGPPPRGRAARRAQRDRTACLRRCPGARRTRRRRCPRR